MLLVCGGGLITVNTMNDENSPKNDLNKNLEENVVSVELQEELTVSERDVTSIYFLQLS